MLSFTRNSDETQQGPGNLKEIVPLLGQGLSLVSRAGPADIHPGKYGELLEAVEQPQRWQFLNCPAFGTIPSFSLFFGFHGLANRLLTLTDFMGCWQSYSSPRLLQGELNVTSCAKLDPYGPGGVKILAMPPASPFWWEGQDVRKAETNCSSEFVLLPCLIPPRTSPLEVP